MGSNNSLITDDRSRNRRSRAASRRAVALREGGFTLAELLIATAISVVMVVMLGWMLGSLMSSATHATERVDAFRDARAALQIMERDLRNILRTQWSSGTAQPLTLPTAYFALDNALYADPAGNNPATGNQQLYALVADRTTASSGDVCAVGYYCRWDGQAYSLRRFFRNSADTFNAIQGAVSTGYAADTVLYAPDASDAVMAAYVWNLKITMYDSGGALVNIYPYICDPNAATPQTLPAAIEISFNAMSPQAARTVMSVSSNPNDWLDTTTQNYQRLIAPHTYQFRSRINLP
jgi:type II secretory pathway pseudopilin PulG